MTGVSMNNIQIQRVFTMDKKQMNMVKDFLTQQQLKFELPVDALFVAVDGQRIIGTGAVQGKIIKMLAVDPAYRGSNIIGMMLSRLVSESFQMGQDHLFIYTKPESAKTFEHLGFYEIARTGHVALLENKKNGVLEHLTPLVDLEAESAYSPANIGAVVVNCNPFTKGHKHLIETASSSVDLLYIFVLSEDRSTFPFEDRIQLVKQGVKHLSNVIVFPSGSYMVSGATFPTYFLGDDQDQIRTQTELDAQVFASKIAKILNIQTRYLGEEPYNPVTDTYNQTLKHVLHRHDIGVEIIKRKAHDGKAISASNVRAYLASGDWKALREIVPETTWNYLVSEKASEIVEKIKKEAHLHKRV